MTETAKVFSNELTDAQLERLAILAEELGEAQQIIGKILRHGYDSVNPLGDPCLTNRAMLVRELGDIVNALSMMAKAEDISRGAIEARAEYKRGKIRPYLHHQEPTR